MNFRGTLERLSDTSTVLRSKTVEGDFEELPSVGSQFIIWSEPFGKEIKIFAEQQGRLAMRRVNTSPVLEVQHTDTGFEFKTEGPSLYKLTLDSA